LASVVRFLLHSASDLLYMRLAYYDPSVHGAIKANPESPQYQTKTVDVPDV